MIKKMRSKIVKQKSYWVEAIMGKLQQHKFELSKDEYDVFADELAEDIVKNTVDLGDIGQQREQLVALIRWFRTDGLYYSKTEEEVVDEFLATNCG